MNSKLLTSLVITILGIALLGLTTSCVNRTKNADDVAKLYPNEVINFMEKWTILLGDGTRSDSLSSFQKDNFFYTAHEDDVDWVVYKTPNSGITSKTSSNTRSELGEKKRWTPEVGGKLTATLKVQHVSTTGDARVPSSFSVVVGQIHSDEGHENEPLKIFYKKYPGHKKGSVFWNYEINTAGSNAGRWDFSTAVWGTDWAVLGSNSNAYPDEPEDGIALGETFRYEVNVYEGIMYLTFSSPGHKTKTFRKSLIQSDFATKENTPKQVLDIYATKQRDGIERDTAYAGEMQFFKQGAYNQANGKSTKSQTYKGDIEKQYEHGSYAEVWFKAASLEAGTSPDLKAFQLK
ncbi:polysaccharide lyase family 7 protein [Algibacter mikhailovii]|uniref:Alginate lyase 2 domain-containing protein n=1 Tax=Algibacter mikhailovii TaxID=425498 RepID=A0A918RFT9_9FLAO|nr:polysaccharide lyase family 7 protein [Algibacter mikhailovii]GGZ93456.1 hypothetical protein GCM10007028_34780 [Algibacter mikhailovii]